MTEKKRGVKIATEILQSNGRWDYKHDSYSFDEGEKGEYFYGEAGGKTIVVPILDDGRLILISQFRYLSEQLSLEFPGGGLKIKESPAEGVARELVAETGFESSNFIKIGQFEPLNGFFKNNIHLFVADELTQKTEPQTLPGKMIEIVYRRPDELDEMIKRGEIWDGQTLAVWALARDFVARRAAEMNQK